MHDLTHAQWRTSTWSGNEGNCVEIADNLPGIVAVRDSKNPNGPALVFDRRAFGAFVQTVKDDRI